MSSEAQDALITLSFDKFWSWLKAHRNCILRAGTPYSIMLDHEDYHWDVIAENEETQVLQMLRGKELVGEVIVLAAEIAYVNCVSGDSDEHMFECIVETAHNREVVYHFVMAHSYDDEPTQSRSWTH